MINKLRKKIFWIIQLSLTIIILGIIIIFAGFSYKNTITSSTMFIDRINGRVDESGLPANLCLNARRRGKKCPQGYIERM